MSGQMDRFIGIGWGMDESVTWAIGVWVDLGGRGNREEGEQKGYLPGGGGP